MNNEAKESERYEERQQQQGNLLRLNGDQLRRLRERVQQVENSSRRFLNPYQPYRNHRHTSPRYGTQNFNISLKNILPQLSYPPNKLPIPLLNSFWWLSKIYNILSLFSGRRDAPETFLLTRFPRWASFGTPCGCYVLIFLCSQLNSIFYLKYLWFYCCFILYTHLSVLFIAQAI